MMSAVRGVALFLIASLAISACGRLGRQEVAGATYVDAGVLASATVEWYRDGERSPFAPRSTGILIVTAEQLQFLTYEGRSGEYRPEFTLSRAGLSCSQRPTSVSKGELWCASANREFLFVSKEAGRIAAVFSPQ